MATGSSLIGKTIDIAKDVCTGLGGTVLQGAGGTLNLASEMMKEGTVRRSVTGNLGSNLTKYGKERGLAAGALGALGIYSALSD